MIETQIHKNMITNDSTYLVKVTLDEGLFRGLGAYENFNGLIDRIADQIAESVRPEIEKQIFSDPAFKERVINEVLVKLANKFANKKIPKKKVK